jgi:SAM-dependent methyltransferase
LNVEDEIISILKESPADEYSLYRQIRNTKLSEITKVVVDLQARNIIYVIKHRKNYRTGLAIPIYSLSVELCKKDRLDIDSLLAGVTSERLVEYPFLVRNLVSPRIYARILDIGIGESHLTKTISKFGKKKWHVIGIDIAKSIEKLDFLSLLRMDARVMGFRDEVFDQIICISTIEHIGIPYDAYGLREENDGVGDRRTMSEIHRILKKGGTVIVTVPYGIRSIRKREHRVYNSSALTNLTSGFSIIKKEYYGYDEGKWKKCNSLLTADKIINIKTIHSHFHSPVCVCLLLQKDILS